MPGSEDRTACSLDPDTDFGIEGEHGVSGAGLIPASVSETRLPDFVAMLEAEFAASEAAEDRGRSTTPSSLGVGELVLTARELAGHSQRRLATEIGTSQPSIASIEAGKRLPTIRTLIRIAEASRLELVVGLRRPGAAIPVSLGALVSNADDGLADFLPMTTPSPFGGPSPSPV
jgi:transcriptional regulator with XRE-family HTH domain